MSKFPTQLTGKLVRVLDGEDQQLSSRRPSGLVPSDSDAKLSHKSLSLLDLNYMIQAPYVATSAGYALAPLQPIESQETMVNDGPFNSKRTSRFKVKDFIHAASPLGQNSTTSLNVSRQSPIESQSLEALRRDGEYIVEKNRDRSTQVVKSLKKA